MSGIDTLNFNGSTNNVTVNSGLTTAQAVNANLTLTIDTATSLENIVGGSGDDTLTGNSLNNTISGVGGNDTLAGGDGDDILNGGLGNDVYLFSDTSVSETDTVAELPGQGSDTLNFSSVTSDVTAILTNDSSLATMTNRRVQTAGSGQSLNFENVVGGSGNDILEGNGAGNLLFGMAGDDIIEGFGGNDSLSGGTGNDSMAGGDQNDTYIFVDATATENDIVSEEATVAGGIDTLDFSSATSNITAILSSDLAFASMTNRRVKTNGTGTAVAFENVKGGSGNDNLSGNSSNNVLTGNGGADVLSGGAGMDTLVGGAGNDILDGGADNDIYQYVTNTQLDSDRIIDSPGVDLLDFSGSTNNVTVNTSLTTTQIVNANLALTFGSTTAVENINGGSGNDTLTGNSVDNRITGNGGNDTMAGRGGSDTYVFGNATSSETDTIVELAAEGSRDALDFSTITTNVTANLTSDTALATMNNRLVTTGAAGQAANIEDVTGGTGNDILIGNAAANHLRGTVGNDVLSGAGGADTLDGDDSLFADHGSDLLIGGAGGDTYNPFYGSDLLFGGIYSLQQDPVALAALQAEWTSASSYTDRLAHLQGTLAGGANGSFTLTQMTVTDDGVGENLQSYSFGEDWFVYGVGDNPHPSSPEIATQIAALPPS